MKALLILSCLVAGVGGGALGAMLLEGGPDASTTKSDVALSPTLAGTSETADEEARARIEAMQLEMANLRAELTALRSERTRESIVADVAAANSNPETTEEEAAANLSTLSEQDKAAVFALMEEAREVRRQEQRVEREQRMNDWTLERATQIANELGLAAGAEKQIGEIMLERNARFSAMREELNDLGWGRETRELMRERAGEINEWQRTSFVNLFGEDVAGQIEDLAGDGRRGGGGGRFGGGGGGGGGNDDGGGGPR